MANAPAHGSWTWGEFVALDESDRRELVEGDLVEVEAPTDIHEYIVTLLAFFLTAWARPRRAGFALVSGYKIRIDEHRGVMPDVQFYRTGNRAVRTRQALESGRPDLVVEVVSESSGRYDRVTKLRYYAGIGVPEYWLVDPVARTLERLLLNRDKYLIDTSAAMSEVFRPDSFEGLEIPLDNLWTIPEQERH
jgi:Uma2 family endonuclease